MQKKSLSEITSKIKALKFQEDFDLVVGIAQGGIVPACIIARHLDLPQEFLYLNFRDKENKPQRKKPELVRPVGFEFKDKRILVIDDRVKTGSTLKEARKLLRGARVVKTLAVNGEGDYHLFNEPCFQFPWNPEH